MKHLLQKHLMKTTRVSVFAAVAAVVMLGALFSVGALTQASDFEYRAIDGTGNNSGNPEFGSAGIQLLRVGKAIYPDGSTPVSEITNPELRGARDISNIVSAQAGSIPNIAGLSDFFWQWGQFLDHDIDLTTGDPEDPFPIPVPTGDPDFDPFSKGDKKIGFNRSIFDPSTGTDKNNPRQQLNLITAYIDASNVYGSDEGRAAALRIGVDECRLKTSGGGKLLPRNTDGLDNDGGPNPDFFLAGDRRSNEQIYLTAMHTLFLLEHNRLCDEMEDDDGMSGEEMYQRARKIVGAQMQVITYKEFLPLLLGPGALPPYSGYDAQVDPGIANEFSTAAYRFGHSMLSEELLRLDKEGNSTGDILLKDAFFNPDLIKVNGGVASLFRGLAAQKAQKVDTMLVDGVRNFLFGPPGAGGVDLASLNIQRDRDHGLPKYNDARQAYGLKKVKSFADITSDQELQDDLEKASGSVQTIDLWVGGLAEDHVAGGVVGETFHAALADQFTRLRDGDRFWHQNDPFFTSNPALLDEVKDTTLADIIRRNTKIGNELQDNVFLVP